MKKPDSLAIHADKSKNNQKATSMEKQICGVCETPLKNPHLDCQHLSEIEKTLARWEDKDAVHYAQNPFDAEQAFKELRGKAERLTALIKNHKQNQILKLKIENVLRRLNLTRELAAETGAPASKEEIQKYIDKLKKENGKH